MNIYTFFQVASATATRCGLSRGLLCLLYVIRPNKMILVMFLIQVNIKKKLEEIAKIELVHRVRVSVVFVFVFLSLIV